MLLNVLLPYKNTDYPKEVICLFIVISQYLKHLIKHLMDEGPCRVAGCEMHLSWESSREGIVTMKQDQGTASPGHTAQGCWNGTQWPDDFS